MRFEDSNLWKWWKKYGMHIQAFIIIFLFLLIIFAYQKSNRLQEEISINCGWGGEDYECYCEKGKALEIKNKMNNPNYGMEGLNVSLDG